MTNINTFKTTAKSGKLLQTALIGLVTAAGLGLIALPAKADEINQGSVQTTRQEGYNNTSVQQSNQNAQIKKDRVRVGRPVSEERSEKDVINQGSDQLTDQVGDTNTSVIQNDQNATLEKRDISIRRDRRDLHR